MTTFQEFLSNLKLPTLISRRKKPETFHIEIKLDDGFIKSFKKIVKDQPISEESKLEVARLNGLAKEQLSYTNFISQFVDKGGKKKAVADASIDGNSNVSRKDVRVMLSEMSKPHQKLIGFSKIYSTIAKRYGNESAYNFLNGEWRGDSYLHDSYSSSFVPYCMAYSLEKLASKGLFFFDGFNNQPPKHLSTFNQFVCEFISWTCNRSSGAVGLPDYLIYSYYFWMKDIQNGHYTRDPEYYRDQTFQEFIYRLNQPFLRMSEQSSFTNVSIFDKSYLVELFGGKTFPDGSFVIDYIDDILEYQKKFMDVVSKVRSSNMLTFPVLTICLLRDKEKKTFVNEEFARWACKHDMKWNDSNFFISKDVTTISNCCRLLSDIKTLNGGKNAKEQEEAKSIGYFNSIGGSSLSVGSVKVNTINLARIALEAKSKSPSITLSQQKAAYLDILTQRTELCCKTLDSIRHIITRNIEKGLLPNYTSGALKMSDQYCTIGIIGIFEALDSLDMIQTDVAGNRSYSEEGLEFAKEILQTIHKTKDEFTAKVKELFPEQEHYLFNLEEVPAERAAAVLLRKDQIYFPEQAQQGIVLYGNQWMPLQVQYSVAEKLRLHSELDKACSGGSIMHFNLGSPFPSFDTAWKMLNMVADSDVPYFAFCTRISACKHNHGFFGETCPTCGEPKTTSYQRIVGFLTPSSAYSKERHDEFQKRIWQEIE